MTVSVPLFTEEHATLEAQARAQGVSVDILVRAAVLEMIAGNGQMVQGTKPTKSCLGALAHLGPAPSAEEIDENRAGIFADLGRNEIA